MKTKNIFKALAFAMLISAMLLTSACVNDEIPSQKGYELPVTVNVTRQGDNASTKATYTYDNTTQKGTLSFSTGDKLFVWGRYNTYAESFYGTLTWQSGGTFSGTITTSSEVSGTAQELFVAADWTYATLLPDGYDTYHFLKIVDNGSTITLNPDFNNAFTTVSKAEAVEQFSYEHTYSYSSGFALNPQNAILNFTISGLTANASNVAVSLTSGGFNISGTVDVDGDGNATFAVGVMGSTDLKNCSLTVGGNAITLVNSSLELLRGKIYNITRSAPSPFANVTAGDLGKLIGADGNIYADADAATEAGTTAVALIAYVGNNAETSTTYNHGLALALSDVSGYKQWCSQKANPCLTTRYSYDDRTNDMAGLANTDELINHGSHTHYAASAARGYNNGVHPTGTSEWFLPSAGQWTKMAGTGGYGYANLKTTAGGYIGLISDSSDYHGYWSSSERSDQVQAWGFNASYSYLNILSADKDYYRYVRACLAF